MRETTKGCISRRQFLKHSATAATLASLQWKRMLMAAPAPVNGPYGAVSPVLTKFVDPIRGIGGTGIPLAGADGFRRSCHGVLALYDKHRAVQRRSPLRFRDPGKSGLHSGLHRDQALGLWSGRRLQAPRRDHRCPEKHSPSDHIQ